MYTFLSIKIKNSCTAFNIRKYSLVLEILFHMIMYSNVHVSIYTLIETNVSKWNNIIFWLSHNRKRPPHWAFTVSVFKNVRQTKSSFNRFLLTKPVTHFVDGILQFSKYSNVIISVFPVHYLRNSTRKIKKYIDLCTNCRSEMLQKKSSSVVFWSRQEF